MQPINERTIQQQVIPTRQRTSGQRETTSNSVKTSLRGKVLNLPEDIITLSKDHSAALSLKKAPSTPVIPAESKALRESFSVYA